MTSETREEYAPPETGIEYAVNWKDFTSSSECLAKHNDLAEIAIRDALGYLPKPTICVPGIAFIKGLIESYENGLMAEDDINKEMLFHLQQIRNKDMKAGRWVSFKLHPVSLQGQYQTYLPHYSEKARTRLSQFLGYEPDLEHSLCAELFLRQLFMHDDFHDGMSWTNLDFKAAMIAKYREAYLTEGLDAADDLGLPGIEYKQPIYHVCERI